MADITKENLVNEDGNVEIPKKGIKVNLLKNGFKVPHNKNY